MIEPKHKMWEYQRSFQRSLENKAREIFLQISSNLEPNIFLLGILRKQGENLSPVCLEPEKKGIELEAFKDIDQCAEKLQTEVSLKDVVKTIDQYQKVFSDNLKVECLTKSIQGILDIHYKPIGKVSFISYPVMIDNYQVFIVLQFDEPIYNSFYSLHQFEQETSRVKKSKVHTSFVNALIHIFLKEATDALFKPNPGLDFHAITTDTKEIFRLAGASFVGTAIPARSRSAGTYDLFDICNYISSLKYEGNVGVGRLLICKEDHPNLNLLIKLTQPVQLRDYRKVRKLLEIASDELHLYCDGNRILGFAEIKGKYNPNDENLFVVNFLDAHKWELIHDLETMMIVEYTNPRLPSTKIERARLESILKRKFTSISQTALNLLWDIINSATEQKQGTLIIISNNAKSEAERLKHQAIPIEPIILKKKIIKLLTSIDGALLFDPLGICYALGVILDGMATLNGSSARGARYNSAIRYIDGNKDDAVSIIISEDGLVDIYPNLRPQIKRANIDEYLTSLKNIVSLPEVDYEVFRSVMNWFEEHKFYLTKEICEEVNHMRDEFNSKLTAGSGMTYILDFKPHPELNESYFINE
jgi:DNA integrity scanning protein DisA with diadenylate cyclase activity